MTKRSFFSLAEFGLTWATDTMRVIQLFWNLLLWWISTGFAWVREHFLFKIYVLIDTLTYYLCHFLYFLVQFCKSYTMIHLFILWIRENICSSIFEVIIVETPSISDMHILSPKCSASLLFRCLDKFGGVYNETKLGFFFSELSSVNFLSLNE